MDALLINGPSRLSGSVRVSGSKNTALPFLFASLLFDDDITFTNVPRLWDIETTLHLLDVMGASSKWSKESGEITISPKVRDKVAPYEWVRKMRAGILALGPLVAKYGEAKVSLPGGCAIGARPVNFHLEAMQKMGVSVQVENGYVHAQVLGRLHAAEIVFPQVTVTGTENLLMVAALTEGVTTLRNAASEPEVTALADWLSECGVAIEGKGTATLHVHGGSLKAPKGPVAIPPDRIETGTWIAASVATRSALTIEGVRPDELSAILSAYREMGVGFEAPAEDALRVVPPDVLRPLSLETHPYPGFPTDMQAQLMLNLCAAEGTSHIRETIFENRFMHVAELNRLGAKISLNGNLATIEGPTRLKGAPVMATDLRASACLVLAALCAEGETKIARIYHLDRGYQRLDEKLRSLGAEIQRVAE